MNPHLLKKPLIVIGFILACTVALLTACQTNHFPVDHEQLSADERIVIKFSHIVGENTPKGLAARKFAKLVNERTNGFVEVQVFPNGYLYKDGEELDALINGDIQMVAPAMSKLSSVSPEWGVIDLPYAFQTSEEVREYLQGRMGEVLFHKLQMRGFHSLGIWDNGFKQMTNNIRPLIEPEDFSGLEFRIMSSSVLSSQFHHLSATTQTKSFNEVYQLLDNQEVNAQENTFSNIESKNLHSLQNYLTISDHGYLGYVVLMNDEFWSSLPEDIKPIIEETMEEVTDWEYKLAEELNEQSFNEIVKCECIDIHYLQEDEKQRWEKAFKPVYQEFEDRFGADYIKNLPKSKKAEDS